MNKIEILKNWLDLYHKLSNKQYDDLTDYEFKGLEYLVEEKLNSFVDFSSINQDLGVKEND